MSAPRRRAQSALRVLSAAAFVAAVGLVGAPSASAHNVLVSTTPAADSTVTALPSQVVLTFEEPPLPGGTSIVVRDPDGTDVTSGGAVLSGAKGTVQLVPLTVPGTYGVSYRSASDDGHTITGSFAFTVPESVLPAASTATPASTPSVASSTPPASSASSPTASSPPAATTTSTSDGSGSGALPWVVGYVALVVVVAAVVAAVRRRST